MNARGRILSSVVALALLGGSGGVTSAAAADGSPTRGVTLPAFYTAPASLPAADGTLIRSEPFKLALNLPGINRPMPGDATRFMYRTTDSTGAPAPVTGAYLEPFARWAGPGPRPLVVLAPGTLGQGDQCSASFGLERPISFGSGGTAALDYEVLAMYRLLSKGVAVAVTDYVGLGLADRLHTYVNRVDQAHAVLDAARAARALPGTSLTRQSKIGLYGYSQGGGATAAAAELQPSYAPDVPLAATYAGAPPADLTELIKAVDGSELVGALAWAINGFVQTEPSLRPIVDRYTSASGRQVLKDLSTMCVGDSIGTYVYAKTSSWTSTGQSLSQIVAAEPGIQSFVARQAIGNLRPAGPVRVSTGIEDNLVPHAQARTMAVKWCGLGGNVTYLGVAAPKLPSPLANHFTPLLSDQSTAIDWVSGVLGGRPATSNCGSINRLP